MPLPDIAGSPSPDQAARLSAFLADLAPSVPAGLELDPEWLPDDEGWNLWVTDHSGMRLAAYDAFVNATHALAYRHGIAILLIPVEVRLFG